MTDKVKVKDSKRMELICEFLKSGKQPEGFIITETKNGKYRLSKVKTNKEVLEARKKCYQKKLDEIDVELKKFEEQEQKQEEEKEQEQEQESNA